MTNVLTIRERQATSAEITATATISDEIAAEPPKRQLAGPAHERGKAAADRERDEQRGFDEHLEHAEARARDRVVGGLLVGGAARRGRRTRRDRVAMRGDVSA